jgi:hypothetical protein
VVNFRFTCRRSRSWKSDGTTIYDRWLLVLPVKLHALANATNSPNWWKELGTIHLYTSTPPLTCDGRRESQHVDTDGKRENQHVDTKGGNSNFIINCENQDSNSRPWALIPYQASCTSKRNQKSELMERARYNPLTFILCFVLRCHVSFFYAVRPQFSHKIHPHISLNNIFKFIWIHEKY